VKYTAEQMVEAIKDSGGIVSVVAQRLGCGRATVYRYRARYVSVRETLEAERAVFLDLAEGALFKAVEAGNLDAIIFALKTLGKERGYTTQIDVNHIAEREIEVMLDALEGVLEPEQFRLVIETLSKLDKRGRAA
jgi:Fe-S cluster assembly scaffold protein SufB